MNQNIFFLLAIFSRRRWSALAVFISVIGGALGYLIFTPRLYEATVRIILDDKQLSVSELGRDLTTQTDTLHASAIATQAELVRSQRVLQRTLNMVFSKGTDNLPKNTVTVSQLKSGLKVSIIPATNILEISYRSQDPVLMTKLLNAVAAAMQIESTEMIRSGAHTAREFLEAEVPKKRKQLAQAEATLSQYKQSQGIVALTDANGEDGSQLKSLVESLTNLESQEQALSAQLQEAKARNNSLRQVADVGKLKDTYAAVRIGEDEELKRLRAQLAELESQVAISRTRLTDNNPALLNLLEKRNATRALYNQKISRLLPKGASANPPAKVASDEASQELYTKFILSEIERSALESKLAAVRNERANLQARINQLPAKQQALATLARQREEAASSLQSLQRKLEETRIAEAQLLGNIRIIDFAKPPTAPSWPSKPVVLVIATAAGIVLAIGIVLLLELIDGTLCNAAEVKTLVNLPVLGVLPVLPADSLDPQLFLKNSQAFESYRTLLKTMLFRSQEGLRVVIVSSSLSGEGKSIVVSHLATVSAMLSQRTLIIDADLRQPTQHKLFNLANQVGLTDVINGYVTLAEAVQQTSIKHLWALTCGENYAHPSQVLESLRMRTLLTEAAKRYDLVIVDTPPLTSCIDATTLSRDSDGLLLVARPNFTPRNILKQAVSELINNQVKIIGVAVNGTETQTMSLKQATAAGGTSKLYYKRHTAGDSFKLVPAISENKDDVDQ